MWAHVTIWDWILIIISWTARSLSEYISRRFLVWCLASLTVQPPHWLTDGLYLKQTDSMAIPGRGSQHFIRKKERVWLLVATVHVKVKVCITSRVINSGAKDGDNSRDSKLLSLLQHYYSTSKYFKTHSHKEAKSNSLWHSVHVYVQWQTATSLYLSPVSESFIGWFFSLYLHSLCTYI